MGDNGKTMAKRFIRLNLGCADLKKEGWINIDNDPNSKADLIADVLELDKHFKPNSVNEIYCGHLIEHLTPKEVEKAISQWRELLKPGGKICLVTPDFRKIVEEYLKGEISLTYLVNYWLYSYVQTSLHKSMWDEVSLLKLLERHGFSDLKMIDRHNDPRLAYSDDNQCGVEGIKK